MKKQDGRGAQMLFFFGPYTFASGHFERLRSLNNKLIVSFHSAVSSRERALRGTDNL